MLCLSIYFLHSSSSFDLGIVLFVQQSYGLSLLTLNLISLILFFFVFRCIQRLRLKLFQPIQHIFIKCDLSVILFFHFPEYSIGLSQLLRKSSDLNGIGILVILFNDDLQCRYFLLDFSESQLRLLDLSVLLQTIFHRITVQ